MTALRSNIQTFGDELDGHPCVSGKDFMKEGRRRPEVVDDDDRHAEIGRQMLEQANVGVEPAG